MYGIIMCPPVRRFPEPPKDQEGCELTICPTCSREAWISAKKRVLLRSLEKAKVYCYDCIETKVRFDCGFRMDFKDGVRVDL